MSFTKIQLCSKYFDWARGGGGTWAYKKFKCYEPLQKQRVKLGACKTGLSPPVTLCYWSFQGDSSVVVLFVLCLLVFIFFFFFCAVEALCVFS